MDDLLKTLKLIERLVIICVAIAALFPMYQWVAESNSRELARTTEMLLALQYCNELEERAAAGEMNLAAIDIYEEICSQVSLQLRQWYQDVFRR